ncbi:MAG TPA: CsgG/HfaB family protein, partial [Planctomycetota bacterium]|nr:CsgG/HfaB family protein [Planctomycetota bacterium]
EVIERAQLDQLLQEQGLEGIVKAGEMARPAEVRGVDYLMIGKVTNFRLKAEKAQRGFGLGRIPVPGAGNLGVFDFKRKDSTITAECGVDIRLVDPTTGSIAAAKSKDYKRTDSIGAFGIDILGANADADATLQVDEDNQGLVLRLALDDALRDMMPILDRTLRGRAKTAKRAEAPAPAEESPDPGSSLVPTDPPAGGGTAAKFCGGCGAKLTPGTKFCGGCGASVSPR